jgi:hypothetical protein
MDHLIDVLIAVVTGVAVLTLISLGLAVIFGMMRVINFAHGEFIMLGGYTTVMATRQGVNVWVAMLALAPLVVGLIGAVAERLIVRRFYGEIVTTMLGTPCQRPEMPCGMTRNRTIAAINKAACPMTGVAMSEKADSTTPNKPAAETVPAISALPPLITVTNARAT